MYEQKLLEILQSKVFLCVLPEGGLSGLGLEWLEFAIEMEKPIFVWRPLGRSLAPLPPQLEGYVDLLVVDGTPEEAATALQTAYPEMRPGQVDFIEGQF